jgi:Uma2 family endonuclease
VDRETALLRIAELPEHQLGEWIAGRLIVSPRPAVPHALAASALGDELVGPFQKSRGGPGGWWILDEPELHLGADVLVPDLAGWRRERMPVLPEAAAIDVPPDWVCEVLSPSTSAVDRGPKLAACAATGVPFAWLVDPSARTLEVLRNAEGRWVIDAVHARGDRPRAPPFEAIEVDLASLWRPEA